MGDIKTDLLTETTKTLTYLNLINECGFVNQNCLPTKVTPTSVTCSNLYSLIVDREIETETLETTFTGFFTILSKTPLKLNKSRKTSKSV